MLAPETVLQNRYRIIRLLGQGGMGAVYEALDERLDTNVALKETLFTDERLRKQFEREARLLARMHHPALPRVSDHFDEGEGQFLVMQFIPGDDLAQMTARKQGPFPPDQVLTWGDQLLDALDYLHTQDPQIIHRDIKPQNLKLTGRGQIILLDFGLAKGQTGGVSMVTTSASIFGYTPNYAPLEQIQGLGTDARSDIYALSATLYHLMTGVKPPDALTRAAALVNGQPDPLMPANEVNASVGPEVATVLARAMSQNKEQRYQSAAGMRAALNGTGEASTLLGKTEAATVLLPPGATVADSTRAQDRETAAQTGETTIVQTQLQARKRSVAPWAIGAAAVVLIGVLFGAFYAYQHRSTTSATTAPTASPAPESTNVPNTQPSPTVNQRASEPSSGDLNGVKKIIISGHPPVSEQPKKNEKGGKNNEKTASGVNPPRREEAEQNPELNIPVPVIPDVNEPDPVRPDRRGVKRLGGGVTTRNFPDGRQLITLPDGTRVVTMPDGTKRVFHPREKMRRNN